MPIWLLGLYASLDSNDITERQAARIALALLAERNRRALRTPSKDT